MARARSFGSIRELPSGKHQAGYWHLGKQIPAEHTYASKTDTRRWLSTVEADIRPRRLVRSREHQGSG